MLKRWIRGVLLAALLTAGGLIQCDPNPYHVQLCPTPESCAL